MARTTLNLDASVLEELKGRAARENKSLGELASELLAAALAQTGPKPARPLVWIAKPLNSRTPLEDWSAVKQVLDDEDMEQYR